MKNMNHNQFETLESAIESQKKSAYRLKCFYNKINGMYILVGGVKPQDMYMSDECFVYIKTDFED